MKEQIKMEGFFINNQEVEVARENLLNQYKEIIRAFDRKDMKRMSLLIYDDFMKHFSATIISHAMIDGRCIKTEVEEFLDCVKSDFIDCVKRMGGDAN
jgi:hypothetical protein